MRARTDVGEVHALAGELLDRRDAAVGAHDEVHLLVEQLGDVDDLVVDRTDLVGALEVGQQVRLRDAEIDALEETHVLDVLPTALADDRQDAEVVAIVEHRREIVGDRHIGGVEIARDDGDRIGIDALAENAELRLVRHRPAGKLRSDSLRQRLLRRCRLCEERGGAQSRQKKSKRFPSPENRRPPSMHDLSPFGGTMPTQHTQRVTVDPLGFSARPDAACPAAPVESYFFSLDSDRRYLLGRHKGDDEAISPRLNARNAWFGMKAAARVAVSGANLSLALRRGAERIERSARMADVGDLSNFFVGLDPAANGLARADDPFPSCRTSAR